MIKNEKRLRKKKILKEKLGEKEKKEMCRAIKNKVVAWRIEKKHKRNKYIDIQKKKKKK